jgi:uncharacterized protein YndB with AHSA1/START domain
VIPPVTRSVTVHQDQATTFDLFVSRIGEWWPAEGFSVGREKVATVVIEPQAGGRVYERWEDGTEHDWGEVLVYEPPQRVVMSWSPGQPDHPHSEVEVVFTTEADGAATTVALEHRGWERLGDNGQKLRDGYDQGWPSVLGRFFREANDKTCGRVYAVSLHQLTWSHLERADRSLEDEEAMANAAHASLHHWTTVGGPLEQARGEWLVSHVYAVLGRGEPARHHAQRCLAITQDNGFADFDLAYAFEAMARAAAASGDVVTADAYRAQAGAAAREISNREDRELFESDLAAGPWWQ